MKTLRPYTERSRYMPLKPVLLKLVDPLVSVIHSNISYQKRNILIEVLYSHSMANLGKTVFKYCLGLWGIIISLGGIRHIPRVYCLPYRISAR
jgi:hypothetical protein